MRLLSFQRADKLACKPEKRRKALVEFIRSARRSLLLSVFRCDDVEVLFELGEAVRRGADVHALITDRAKGWRRKLGPLEGLLGAIGVHVHPFGHEGTKYHAKYMVADCDRSLITTSNLTRKCSRRTRDYVLVTHDSGVADSLHSLFWSDVAGTRPTQLSERLIVGPQGSRAQIESLLAGARRSISIQDHKLSDPAVLRILLQQCERGVEVDIDSRGGDKLHPHGRALVIDGELAVIGSFALTAASLDRRREIGIMVRDPSLVAKIGEQIRATQLQCVSQLVA